jgi:hypothetical protein
MGSLKFQNVKLITQKFPKKNWLAQGILCIILRNEASVLN